MTNVRKILIYHLAFLNHRDYIPIHCSSKIKGCRYYPPLLLPLHRNAQLKEVVQQVTLNSNPDGFYRDQKTNDWLLYLKDTTQQKGTNADFPNNNHPHIPPSKLPSSL